MNEGDCIYPDCQITGEWRGSACEHSCPFESKAKATRNSPYGVWCRKPDACAGKGYCPLDPTCGD